jgi:hypothetical protein
MSIAILGTIYMLSKYPARATSGGTLDMSGEESALVHSPHAIWVPCLVWHLVPHGEHERMHSLQAL